MTTLDNLLSFARRARTVLGPHPRRTHRELTLLSGAVILASSLLVTVATDSPVVHAGLGPVYQSIGGFVWWESIDGACDVIANLPLAGESCAIVGSSFIAELRHATTVDMSSREDPDNRSRYRLLTILVDDDGTLYKSGLQFTHTWYNTTFDRMKTDTARVCSAGDHEKMYDFVSFPSLAKYTQESWDIGIIGHQSYASSCAVQNNCGYARMWECITVLNPGTTLRGDTSGNHAKVAGIPMHGLSANYTWHGLEALDKDKVWPWGDNPTLGLAPASEMGTAVTGFDWHIRDNLYYFMSEVFPLQYCGSCYGPSDGWEDDSSHVVDWPSASFSVQSFPGAIYNQSGGSNPRWDSCYKFATDSPCFCEVLSIVSNVMEQDTVPGPPTPDVTPFPTPMYASEEWDVPLVDPPYAGMPPPAHPLPTPYIGHLLFASPSNDSMLDEYTEDLDEAFNFYRPELGSFPGNWSEGATIRYNCHGRTFASASFSSPLWLNLAEQVLPPCLGNWYEIYEDTPPAPGDVVVWFNDQDIAMPGFSVHSATLTGNWAGEDTVTDSKNGRGPEYDNLTIADLTEIYEGPYGNGEFPYRFFRNIQ